VAAFGSLRHAYHTIHARIAAALRSLGADATLAPHQPPPSSRVDQPTPCFATPVGGEVLVAGRKLVGSAQVRKGNAFLQHGSILLDGSQEIIAAVSSAPHVAGTETTLTAALDRPVSFEEVAEAVIEAFGDVGAQHAAPLPSDSPTVRPPSFRTPMGPGAARHRGEILGAMPTARPRAGLTCAA